MKNKSAYNLGELNFYSEMVDNGNVVIDIYRGEDFISSAEFLRGELKDPEGTTHMLKLFSLWLESECEVSLSQGEERLLKESKKEGYHWIAKDSDGVVCVFINRPTLLGDGVYDDLENGGYKKIDDFDFPWIKPKKRYKIERLLNQ